MIVGKPFLQLGEGEHAHTRKRTYALFLSACNASTRSFGVRLGGSLLTVPPAAVIFSSADLLKRWAEIGQLLRDLAIPENFDLVEGPLCQILRCQRLESDFGTILECVVDLTDVDRKDGQGPAVVEASFGNAAEHWHRPALEVGLATVSAAALVSFVSTAGGLTVSRYRHRDRSAFDCGSFECRDGHR